jgi:hypothetical protein
MSNPHILRLLEISARAGMSLPVRWTERDGHLRFWVTDAVPMRIGG